MRMPRARTLEFVDLVPGAPDLAIIRIGLDPVPDLAWQQVFDGIAARVLWPGGFTPTLSARGVDLVVAEADLEQGVGLVELLVTRVNERCFSPTLSRQPVPPPRTSHDPQASQRSSHPGLSASAM